MSQEVFQRSPVNSVMRIVVKIVRVPVLYASTTRTQA